MVNKLFFLLIPLSLFASVTIEDAWQSVVDKNSGLKSNEDKLKRAELKKNSAKSMYLPAVTLSGSYTHLSDPIKLEGAYTGPLTGTQYPFRVDLSKEDVFLADLHMLWPLYTGGKIDAAQDIYASQVNEAKAKEAMKKDEAFLKLVKYYYGVVVSEALFQTRKTAQKALELHYENAKKLKDQGQIANIELLNAEVKLDAARIETNKAKHNYEIASSALKTLTQLQDKPTSKLFVNADMNNEEYYKRETQQNYAGLKILDAKEAQSKSVIKLKEAAWHPKVAAYGNYNLYKDDSLIMQTLPTWFAGVVVKIDLFQRKDRSQDIQAAELLSAEVQHLKAQALEDLKLLVEKTYKEMLADYEEFNALNSSLALARENYRVRQIAFNEGLSTSVELVDAQMFLLAAKTKRLNAAYNFVQKVSQLCVLIGKRELFFEIANRSKEIE